MGGGGEVSCGLWLRCSLIRWGQGHVRWGAGESLTAGSLGKAVLTCSIRQFPWCEYSQPDALQASGCISGVDSERGVQHDWLL